MEFIIFLILLALGYGFGRYNEAKHYKSIRKREAVLRRIPVFSSKILPTDKVILQSKLVSGSVVISVDYFKRFMASIYNLLGGRITSYETLLERARREAILRMKQEAKKMGAQQIFNVKFETSSVSQGQQGTIGSVEVLVYGTALRQEVKNVDAIKQGYHYQKQMSESSRIDSLF